MENFEMHIQEYIIAILQHERDVIDLTLHQYLALLSRNSRKRCERRRYWARPWIARRKQFGLYDQLMVGLRNDDHAAFINFLRMPPAMFDELLTRVGPKITKQSTTCREPLEPCMKLALTLRHLACGNSYASMKFGWRVPHNTQSIIVREVCKAILDGYLDEVLSLPCYSRILARCIRQVLSKMELACGAIDGKHRTVGPSIIIIKDSTPLC